MDMTKLPLLRKVLEHITAHPEEHDQNYWGYRSLLLGCGTTHCIGGWALVLSGADLAWATSGDLALAVVDGQVSVPLTGAQKVLGLTDGEAGRLFYAKNLDRAWVVVEDITDGVLLRSEVEAAAR